MPRFAAREAVVEALKKKVIPHVTYHSKFFDCWSEKILLHRGWLLVSVIYILH